MRNITFDLYESLSFLKFLGIIEQKHSLSKLIWNKSNKYSFHSFYFISFHSFPINSYSYWDKQLYKTKTNLSQESFCDIIWNL